MRYCDIMVGSTVNKIFIDIMQCRNQCTDMYVCMYINSLMMLVRIQKLQGIKARIVHMYTLQKQHWNNRCTIYAQMHGLILFSTCNQSMWSYEITIITVFKWSLISENFKSTVFAEIMDGWNSSNTDFSVT